MEPQPSVIPSLFLSVLSSNPFSVVLIVLYSLVLMGIMLQSDNANDDTTSKQRLYLICLFQKVSTYYTLYVLFNCFTFYLQMPCRWRLLFKTSMIGLSTMCSNARSLTSRWELSNRLQLHRVD